MHPLGCIPLTNMRFFFFKKNETFTKTKQLYKTGEDRKQHILARFD